MFIQLWLIWYFMHFPFWATFIDISFDWSESWKPRVEPCAHKNLYTPTKFCIPFKLRTCGCRFFFVCASLHLFAVDIIVCVELIFEREKKNNSRQINCLWHTSTMEFTIQTFRKHTGKLMIYCKVFFHF